MLRAAQCAETDTVTLLVYSEPCRTIEQRSETKYRTNECWLILDMDWPWLIFWDMRYRLACPMRAVLLIDELKCFQSHLGLILLCWHGTTWKYQPMAMVATFRAVWWCRLITSTRTYQSGRRVWFADVSRVSSFECTATKINHESQSEGCRFGWYNMI